LVTLDPTTYLPVAFNGDFDSDLFALSTEKVLPFSIFEFPEEIIDEWLFFGNSFFEVFTQDAIEYVETFMGDFDDFDYGEFESEDADICTYFENRDLFKNLQVEVLQGQNFYYNRIGQRCFEISDIGFDNNQFALMYALDTNNIINVNNTHKIVDEGIAPQMASDVIRSFMDKQLWKTLFSDDTFNKNYTEFLEAADRVQGFCSGYSWRYNQVDSCKIELASFLAHASYQTNNETDAYDETEEWFYTKAAGAFTQMTTPACVDDSFNAVLCKQGPLGMDKATYDNFFEGKITHGDY